MGRQEEILNLNNNLDDKDYKYILITNSGGIVPVIVELKYAPDGWDDEIIFERDEKYKGVFRKYADGEIKFVKDGREHVKNIYESKGINAESVLQVYKLSHSTYDFEMQFEGKLDFSTYKIDEIYASVQVMDNNFSEKFKNRANVEVNLNDNVSIDGGTFPAIDPTFREFHFPETDVTVSTDYQSDDYSQSVSNETATPIRETIQMDIGNSGIPQAQSQDKQTSDVFYNTAPSDVELRVRGSIKGNILIAAPGNGDVAFKVMQGGVTKGTLKAYTNVANNVKVPFEFTDEDTGWFTILSGGSISLEVEIDVSGWYPSGLNYEIEIETSSFNLELLSFDLDQQKVSGFQYYEALYQILRKTLNTSSPLYSEYFGRTDATGTAYASDGQLGAFLKGTMIRNIKDVIFSMSFDAAFESLNALFCIGAGQEKVSGVDKIRIEGFDYFFDDEVVLDVSDRLSVPKIGKEVLPDWHYAKIKCGYADFENEIDGAIFEFNNKQEFATVISSLGSLKNSYDIRSEFRADSNGINVLRSEYDADTSEDVDGDDDIFIVDTLRDADPAIDFIARTDEDFDTLNGVPTDSNNVLLTPKRNLLRHGAFIRAGLERELNKYVTFQAATRKVSISTKLSTETDSVSEQTDIRVSDLADPRWWAEAYIVDECPFYMADIKAIEANPRGLIKLADDMYGWILKIKTSKENKASLKLLRCNLNYVTPS